MAEHKVQLPDNSIITIEGPDDATDQELIDAASKHYSAKQSKPAASAESQPVTAPTVQSMTDSARNMDAMTYGAGAAAGVGVLAGAKLLKDKFFGAEKPKQSIERIEPQMDVSQKKPSEPFLEPETQTVRPTDWESSLSAEDRQLLERSRANAAVKAAQPAPVTTPAGGNVVPQAQIPAAAQPAPVVPPAPVVEAPVNLKLPALLQPPAGAAPPPVVAPAIAEPVASPVLPTTPIKTDNALITAAQAAPVAAETIELAKVEPAKSKKAPKPEYFEGYKNLPGTERQLLGTLGVANNTERAKSLVDALKSTLPEGAALEFPKTEAGVSKGGMPNPQDVMAFTNKHLGTAMKLDEKGKFPADFRYTEENLAKMHQSILDEYANAKTPSAKAAAEKGFATLRSLAGLAGFGALAYGSLEAYKHGKKTGDWTPAGELGLNTIAGAINPALMLGTHMTGLNAGEEQELAKRRYNAMVGGGRGTTPASAYKR
jgi:hypothetical protein